MRGLSPPRIVRVLDRSRILGLEPGSEIPEDKKLVVVSIFGSTTFSRTLPLPTFKRAFQLALDNFGSLALYSKPEKGTEGECVITGFYNEIESVLILNLDGPFDPQVFLDACKTLSSTNSNAGFMSTWTSLNSKFCQSLLLLFSLSHVMVLSSVSSYFDTSYLHLFKALETFRREAKPFMTRLLDGLDGLLPRQWIDHGRLCSPRMLFVFDVASVPTSKVSIGNSEPNPLKDLRKKLETEIYHVLRKCRIITNVCSQSLFAIPATQEHFIFLYDKDVPDGGCENNAYTFSHFIQQFCSNANQGKSFGGLVLPSPSASPSSSKTLLLTPQVQQPVSHRDFVAGFRNFLLKHVKLALNTPQGFDDNSSQAGENKHFFVLPTWGEWKEAYEKLSSYLIRRQYPAEAQHQHDAFQILDNLSQYLNVDAEYLENQCSKMFPKAFAVYTKNIPDYYSAQEHQSRLSQAINSILTISRGPAMLPWLDRLTEKCYNYWKRDHEQCETRSLHEHSCVNRLHRVSLENHLEVLPYPSMDETLPEMKHTTGNRLTSYCNCGRRQGSRDEPFTIREANYSYYQRTGRDCCEKLEHWNVPIFSPPAETVQGEGLTLQEMLKIIQNKGRPVAFTETNIPILEGEEELENPSQVMEAELRQRNNEEEDEEELEENAEEESQNEEKEGSGSISTAKEGSQRLSAEDGTTETEALLMSQEEVPDKLPSVFYNSNINIPQVPITIELEKKEVEVKPEVSYPPKMQYLPGMIHSKSIPGLFPLFPSWSLVCLGPSNAYAHTSGIQHQPGFLAGTNFLLPLDVTVKAEAGVSKPVPRLIRGKAPSRQVKRITDEFSVKVFIGFEYECKKGHRFMVESSEKVLLLHTSRDRDREFNPPNMREAASKVAASDLHLYFRCPCNASTLSDNIAQLMRVHVVTPKAPVHVTLHPRVQPGPSPCPLFTPGNIEPIKLSPSKYWVLRLPYSYVTEDQVYVPPKNVDSYNGKLLRGLIQVVSMSTDETKAWESTE